MATYRESGIREPQPGTPPIDPETAPMHGNGTTGASVGSLLGELISETTAMMRAEVTLARNEMHDNLGQMQRGAMAMATGGAILGAGFLALCAAAILALAPVMADWLAAFIVGVVLVGAGAIALAIGKRKAMQEGLRPQRTLGSLTDMREMARSEKDRATRKWR